MEIDIGKEHVTVDFKTMVLEANNGKNSLFFVGQAGFIIKNRYGELLAVDLYLSDCVEELEGHIGYKRLLPKIITPNELEYDYIIATHPHWDHYDIKSIPQMMAHSKTRLFVSKNCLEYNEKYHLDNKRIIYVKPGESYEAGNFRIHFVSCDHGEGTPDAVGVIIQVDGKIIYMTGDTCLRLDRINEYKQYGEIDILIGPINGAYGNMNEQEFAEFSKALSPKITIPCHYGMFASHGGDPGKFLTLMSGQQSEYLLMAFGEKYAF